MSLTVKVFDNSLGAIESARGSYSITLTISSGSWTGTKSGTTTAGILNISNLRILSTGTFSIIASSQGVRSGTSASISVSNVVHSIELSSTTLTPTVNFEFTLTATLKGEDQNLFTGLCQTSITETGGSVISGTISTPTSTGTVAFQIYFSTIGQKIIQATCNSVVGSITLTAVKLALKFLSVNPAVITT